MTSPQQVARNDQLIATARDLGRADPTTAVFTVIEGGEGRGCSWCDCPVSDHERPGYVCPGCDAKATHIVYAMHGTRREIRLPMCEPHLHGDFAASLAALAAQLPGGAR